MKIGLISTAFPMDLETSVFGLFKRFGMFVQALKEMADLDMLFFVRPEVQLDTQFVADAEKRLSNFWRAKIQLDLCNLAPAKPPRGRWQEYVLPALSIVNYSPYDLTSQREQIEAVHRMMARKPDILFVHRLHCMVPVLLSGQRHPAIHFDLDDIEHVSLSRSIGQPPLWPGKRLQYLRLPSLKSWERRAIRLSRATYVCSEHDRQYLSELYSCNNVAVVPNAVEIPGEHRLSDQPILLFLGQMSYGPNAVAADYLIRRIWPAILSAVPNARLLIAGARPERIESFGERPPGVEFVGFVDDLEKLYERVMIVCCPIVSGGGTRIKILEAAAYGKAVVSTTIGAEGLNLRNGEEIVLCDDPAFFAKTCVHLLENRGVAERLGQSARTTVRRCYDRNVIVDLIKMRVAHPEGDASS